MLFWCAAGGGALGCLLPGLDDFPAEPALDASTDAGVVDAPPSDAPVGDAAGSFCTTLSPKPTFCADFDDDDFPAGFDKLVQFGEAKGLLDNGALGNPARSFSASVTALTGTKQGASHFEKAFGATPKTLRIELDYLPTALETTERAILRVGFSNDKDQIVFLVRSSGARIAESSTLADGGTEYAGGPLSTGFTVGVWTHVKWTITIGATTSSSSVSLGSTAVEFDSLHAHRYASGPTVNVGLIFVGAPSNGWAIRVDNVVIDLQ